MNPSDWIPCSERMPPFIDENYLGAWTDDVLIQLDDHSYDIAQYTETKEDWNENEWTSTDGWGTTYKPSEVLRWMPIVGPDDSPSNPS